VGVRSIPLGIAAVVLGFVLKSPGTRAGPADVELRVERPGISVFGTIHPDIFRLRAPIGSQPPVDRVRVASLEPQVGSDAAADEQDILDAPALSWRNASFKERFGDFDDRLASFDERFASVDDRLASFDERFASVDDRLASFDERFASVDDRPAFFGERFGSATRELTGSVRLPPDRDVQKAVRPLEGLADAPPTPTASKRHVRPAQARRDSVPPADDDGRTAIYDITAHAVYLPNGRRLEAHSGLGGLMDNPRHAHVRMRGATPPNVYNLSLRERLFHGVRAIRLTPVDSGRMYGRAGILAHSYMLGPNGQSNGCVSFSNYPEFLNAFLKGEVSRLVVVERIDNPPGPKLASGWLPEVVRNLFKASDRSGQYAAAGGH
jgi:hypothetical protein